MATKKTTTTTTTTVVTSTTGKGSKTTPPATPKKEPAFYKVTLWACIGIITLLVFICLGLDIYYHHTDKTKPWEPLGLSAGYAVRYFFLVAFSLWLFKVATNHRFSKTNDAKDSAIRKTIGALAFFGPLIVLIITFIISVLMHNDLFKLAIDIAELIFTGLKIAFCFVLLYVACYKIVEYLEKTFPNLLKKWWFYVGVGLIVLFSIMVYAFRDYVHQDDASITDNTSDSTKLDQPKTQTTYIWGDRTTFVEKDGKMVEQK